MPLEEKGTIQNRPFFVFKSIPHVDLGLKKGWHDSTGAPVSPQARIGVGSTHFRRSVGVAK
jgi:hypothetical protein